MGSRHLFIAAPLLLASPVLAQDAQPAAPVFSLPPATTTSPPADAGRQGPELDPLRAPDNSSPATAAPTIMVPPAVTPPAAPQAPSARPAPAAQTPAPRPATTRPQSTPAPAVQAAPTPAAPTNDSAPAAAQPQPQPQAQPAPAANAAQPVDPAPEQGPALPWILGGAFALVALAGATLTWRRRRPTAPARPQSATPVRPASPPAPPAPPPASSGEAPPPAPPLSDADRPWLDMDLTIGQARLSLVGVTISYTLLLHNRGAHPAHDILVRGTLGNAGPAQQALLEAFFAGQGAMPLHSSVAIAPGETLCLPGELRLSADQVVPVEMGQRRLLIPLAAFDASYRWGEEDSMGDPQGSGRTARAFIVGQEQQPPTDRLAPLRLDQGPRQYPRPAARAAAELPPA